jgi:hypothetical protein
VDRYLAVNGVSWVDWDEAGGPAKSPSGP